MRSVAFVSLEPGVIGDQSDDNERQPAVTQDDQTDLQDFHRGKASGAYIKN